MSKEAIELLEKRLKMAIEACGERYVYLSIEEVENILTFLKQQQIEGELTKEIREEISELLPLPGSNQLKCSQCGGLVEYNTTLTYDAQSHCEKKDGGQMMGIGWAGWLNMMRDFIRFEVPKLCDRLDSAEARLKAMYAGDLSPESRLSGYKVITDQLNQSRGELLEENVKLQDKIDTSEARLKELLEKSEDLLSAIGPKGYFPSAGYTRTKALRDAVAKAKKVRE